MEVTSRLRDGVVILDLTGGLVGDGADLALRGWVQRVLEEGATKILINLKGVVKVDGSGVAELASAQTTVTTRGARLALASLPEKLASTLEMTSLNRVFEAYDNEDDAISSFS
jgi:anti-anti-sigma factor